MAFFLFESRIEITCDKYEDLSVQTQNYAWLSI